MLPTVTPYKNRGMADEQHPKHRAPQGAHTMLTRTKRFTFIKILSNYAILKAWDDARRIKNLAYRLWAMPQNDGTRNMRMENLWLPGTMSSAAFSWTVPRSWNLSPLHLPCCSKRWTKKMEIPSLATMLRAYDASGSSWLADPKCLWKSRMMAKWRNSGKSPKPREVNFSTRKPSS